MPDLVLTEEERELLEDVLGYWLYGYNEAEEQLFNDGDLEVDETLTLLSSMDYTKFLTKNILQRVSKND